MIKFLVNQVESEVVDLDPNTTLLEYLRDHLHRCGTKEGCGTGDCGTCTVVIGQAEGDGLHYQAVNACMTLIGSLHGKQLITLEDLSCGDGLHPVQQALVDCHASRCGFCIPGVAMSLFAYRKNHQKPDRASIIQALEGNLCRCTGYRPMIDAAMKMFETDDKDIFSESKASVTGILNKIQRENSQVSLKAGGKSYFAPASIQSLSSLLLEQPRARLVAGGTDLCLEITQSLQEIDVLISLERVRELGSISRKKDFLEIGAAVTFSGARQELTALYPHLSGLIDRLGSLQIRNTGTLAGNIATASATGDMSAALIAMGARLRLRRGDESRSIRVEDFFVGPKTTALSRSEFIEQIRVPVPANPRFFRVYKISKRTAVDISSTCGAFNLCLDGNVVRSVTIAFAGMAEIPKRAKHCEQELLGQELCEATVKRAMQALAQDFTAISDVRATAEYRLEVSRNLLRRLFIEYGCVPGHSRGSHLA